LLVIVIAAFFWIRAGLKKELHERKRYMQKSALIGLLLCFVVLALTGRLSWILAVLSVFIAFVSRFIPVILRPINKINTKILKHLVVLRRIIEFF
jgi:hypothetical protein